MGNTFKAMVVKGKKAEREWTGLAIQAMVNGVEYKGMIFPKNDTIQPDKEVKFQ